MATLSANRGLITQPSELTRPDGAMEVLDNCVIDSDNTVEQRRGFAEFGAATPDDELIKQLMVYKGRILRHYANKIAFDSDGNGAFVEFDGVYMELTTKLRIKYLESNGNLYFTTTEGIKKISAITASEFTSAPNYITNAGGVKAIGLEARIKPEESGWLPAQSKVGYKVLWAIKDVNNNLIQGVPSSRVVVSNTSQDVNVGERFSLTVVSSAGLADGEFFTFDTPTNQYGVWFNISGTATPPSAAALVGRSLLEVETTIATPAATLAAQLATVLSTITDVTVELNTNEVSISNVDGGDVLDASQGTVATTDIVVSTIYNGQTAVGIPANVTLTFSVPYGVTSDLYFYEVYRTGISTASATISLTELDPGEEFQKVYEAGVTPAEITAGTVTVEDITPESFREGGLPLYVNPVTGEGILQANEAPPIAKDIALFKSSVFYANTKERHRKQINLLSVADFTSGTSKFYVGNSTVFREYIFRGTVESVNFTVLQKSLTVGNGYIVLNSAQDRISYKLWLDKGIINNSFDSTAGVNIGTETITTAAAHDLADGDKVVAGGILPAPLISGTSYYVVGRTPTTLQLALTSGGPAIDLTATAVGTGTLVHTPEEPVVANTVSLRVALQTFPDTIQGSTDAFLDAFFDINDFSPTDLGAGVIQVYNTDNGASTDPVNSSNWSVVNNTQGTGEDAANHFVLLSGLASVGQSVEDTARSLERVINKDAQSPVIAFYLSGLDDLPGILLLEAKSLLDDPFYVGVNEDAIVDKWNPSIPSSKVLTDVAIAGTFSTSSNHGYLPGDSIYIFDNPTGTKTEFGGKYTIALVPNPDEFTLVGITPTINQVAIVGYIYKAEVGSDNAINQNRLYFSKAGQPEAVPLVNYIDIGPKDKAIQRILALRDSLIVLKEDGVYVVSGPLAPDFSVRLVDSSALTLAPDTAANLNNLIYVLTTQGVVTVSETGVGVISRNIENKIQEIANNKFDYKLTSWGVSSESDRCYIIWMPTRLGDSVSTQAYRYNTFTRTWTRWTKPANCGVVNPADDKIYLGDASGRFYTLQERKNFERQDYADRDFMLQFNSGFMQSPLEFAISSAAEVTVGDVITQNQYIDINKFNRLLKKLDRDNLLSDNYFSTLEMQSGEKMEDTLEELRLKLVADGILVPAGVGGNTAILLQTTFNDMIDYLNGVSSGTSFKDYKTADDLLVYETLINTVNKRRNLVTVKVPAPLLEGDFTVYKAIITKVQYVPQHFGKPETTKQISEGTFIFDQNNFWGGTVGYSTDRSYDFQSYSFEGRGPGYWDSFIWSELVWGGGGNEVPVRTLVPIEKTRCRYIHVQFEHTNAREKWRLLGVSLEPREVSPRGYRQFLCQKFQTFVELFQRIFLRTTKRLPRKLLALIMTSQMKSTRLLMEILTLLIQQGLR